MLGGENVGSLTRPNEQQRKKKNKSVLHPCSL